MSKVEEVVQSIENKNPNNLVIGDKVHYKNGKNIHIGKVTNVYEEMGKVKVDVAQYKKENIVIDASLKNLQPMFTIIADKKIPLQFVYSELIENFNNGNFKTLKFDDLKKTADHSGSIVALLKGDSTKVFKDVELQSKATPQKPSEFYKKDVRFELQRNVNNNTTVNRIESQATLNVTQMYGKAFTKLEQSQLIKNGTLGLVSDLTNKKGEIFDAWISVDKELNKLVASSTYSVNIEKIRGKETTPEEQASLKSGKGIIRGAQYLTIDPSSTSNDSVRTHSADYAKSAKLPTHSEKKNKLENKETKKKGITK